MAVLDIFIVYLAFGAPIAVYKYLQDRDTRPKRRLLSAVGTFLFWIPAAVRIGHLYISNAYFGDGFVSPVDSDSSAIVISDLRENVRLELVRPGIGIGMHDAREMMDRYVGLATAVRDRVPRFGTAHQNFFEAAGRKDSRLSVRCINIRNRRRLERHHARSRNELVKLFEERAVSAEYKTALKSAIRLARELDDIETFEQLSRLMTSKAEIWNSESRQQKESLNVVPVIAVTRSLNSE